MRWVEKSAIADIFDLCYFIYKHTIHIYYFISFIFEKPVSIDTCPLSTFVE